METALATGKMSGMTQPDDMDQRLAALDRRRRGAKPRITIERLLKAAGYKGIQTWYSTLAGESPIETVERFEQALDDLIAHPDDVAEEPTHVTSTPEGLMEFEVTGDFGVRVVVRGPVSNAEELERAAAKIIRDIRGTQAPNQGMD